MTVKYSDLETQKTETLLMVQKSDPLVVFLFGKTVRKSGCVGVHIKVAPYIFICLEPLPFMELLNHSVMLYVALYL